MPINLAGVQEKEGQSFEPIPEGFYYLRVTNGAEIDANGDKKDQHEFELTVQVGPYANRKFKHWFVLSEKLVPYLKHLYKVLGAKSFDNLSPTDFISRPFAAEIVIDEYNGKRNNKLQIGCYYEWDGKDESATGVKPEKKEGSTVAASAPATTPATTAAKPAAKKSSPFSNAKPADAAAGKKSDDEPPF